MAHPIEHAKAGACTECIRRTGNDRTLFPDVRQGDICTLPNCYHAKVSRFIDVTLEELKAADVQAEKISTAYNRNGQTPKDVLVTAEYEVVSKGKTCADTKVGIYVDGPQQGRKVSICTSRKCAVHHFEVTGSNSSPARKEQRAKARKESAARVRIFSAIHSAASKVKRSDLDYISLAEFALQRADHNGLMKLAKLLDWPKELFGWDGRKKLRSKLEQEGVESSILIALLASVSTELSVSEFHSGKAERLEALAKSIHVDVGNIRKQVEAEFAAKGNAKQTSGTKATATKKASAGKQKAARKTAGPKQK